MNDARAGKAADVAGWPIVARDDVIRRCAAALSADSEHRGVVLVGDSGVGKTTVARQLVRAADPTGKATTRFVLGTQTGRGTPLGAFCRLLPADVAKEPAVMLAAAHRVLAEYRDLILVFAVGVYALQRDPALWERATEFDPDRFAPESAKQIDRWQYLPFGAGPRTCVGDHFAMLELALALATIVQHSTI